MKSAASDTANTEFLGRRNGNLAFFTNKTILWVEGEDDRKFWRIILGKLWQSDEWPVKIETPSNVGQDRDGKRFVMRLFKEAEEAHKYGGPRTSPPLAIVDRDFDPIHEMPGLFYYDFADRETMLASTDAFRTFLKDLVDNSKFHTTPDLESSAIRATALFGEMRQLIARAKMGVEPKVEFDESCFTCCQRLNLDRVSFVSRLGNQRDLQPPNSEKWTEVESQFLKIPVTAGSKGDLNQCRGHDLIQVLEIALVYGGWGYFEQGDAPETTCNSKVLHSKLTLSFEAHYIHGTQLYKNLQAWETEHGRSIFPGRERHRLQA